MAWVCALEHQAVPEKFIPIRKMSIPVASETAVGT
jgi:hypothetical protein